MYIPFDARTQINPQDDDFLDAEVGPREHPEDKFPLLLNFHPLVIYRLSSDQAGRHGAGNVPAGNEFTLEQKKRNFDYYDELTTGDSSLSACIQSIVAPKSATTSGHELSRYALLMDLADVGENVKDGPHRTMGGTWMGVVYGLAGLRDRGGRLCFKPNRQVQALRFRLTVRGQQLAVEMETGSVTYTLERGDGLTIYHVDERLDLRPGEPVHRS